MNAQDRIKLKTDGRLGTLSPTIYLLLSDGDDPLSVTFDGETSSSTLNCFDGGRDAFEIIGKENATPKPKKCGAGKGGECCIFLTVGTGGFACERHGSFRHSLMFKTMTAKRNPPEPFPHCMNQGD